MSNEKHTQEPWRANDAQADIDGPNGEPVAVCYCNDESGDDAKENARRIVACVNACAGIDTELLEIIADNDKTLAGVITELEKQRDTFLAALERIVDSDEYTGDSFVCDFATLQSVARAAIASVKGGAA